MSAWMRALGDDTNRSPLEVIALPAGPDGIPAVAVVVPGFGHLAVRQSLTGWSAGLFQPRDGKPVQVSSPEVRQVHDRLEMELLGTGPDEERLVVCLPIAEFDRDRPR